MNDHRTSLQHLNGHIADTSHKDNDNTTQPQQQPLLMDTISAEPCPQSSPQSDYDMISELLPDSAPKDDFLENSEGIQDSILHPPITPEQQPISPDTLSLSPASPLLCFSEKMEQLVSAGTKLSHSFAASPQIPTKKRQAPKPPKLSGPARPPPPKPRVLRPLPQRQGSQPPPSARENLRPSTAVQQTHLIWCPLHAKLGLLWGQKKSRCKKHESVRLTTREIFRNEMYEKPPG
ncbi:hypothetical protein F2P79_000690 [Pimephales promelas]|nr:hypothetical protein F2P79_000690 [Pimephales promelas]